MKLKVYIGAQAPYSGTEFMYSAFSFDPSNMGYILVDEMEIEFNEPPRDVLVNGAISAYRAEQQKIRAEAQSKITLLDEKIQSLLALEFTPTAEDDGLPF